MQLAQLRHGRDGGDVGDGVVRQIEHLELGQTDQRIDRLDGAVAERQAREIGEGSDRLQHALRERAAREIQCAECCQRADDAQVKRRGRIVDGEGLKTRKEAQVTEGLRLLGDGELLDLPKLVGHDLVACRFSELLAHSGVHRAVLERDRLDHISDRVARIGRAADKAVCIHRDGNDGRLAAGQRDRAGVEIRRKRREIGRRGEIDRAGSTVRGDIDILAVIAALRRQNRRCRAKRLDGGLHRLVCDAAKHLLGIHELVLRDVCAGKLRIQLDRFGVARDGADQRVLSLGVIPAENIRLCEPAGDGLILRLELLGLPVKGDGAVVAAGLLKAVAPVDQHACGQIFSENKEKQAGADQKRGGQNQQDDISDGVFFHWGRSHSS